MRAAVLALLLASCAGTLPRPTDQTAALAASRWPGTTRADLELGRELYVNRCSSCHALVQPGRFPEEKWHKMVNEMAPRAKLQPRDREVVLRYLSAFAKGG